MSMGVKVWDANEEVVFDSSAYLYRVIGYGVIVFNQNEITTKSITIPNMVDSDKLVVQTSTAALAQISISRSGNVAQIQRVSVLLGSPTSYNIMCVR